MLHGKERKKKLRQFYAHVPFLLKVLHNVLRGDKELKSFDLHPGDYTAVF
jgi:hypothetical protein